MPSGCASLARTVLAGAILQGLEPEFSGRQEILTTTNSLTADDLGSAAQRDRRRRILDATIALASKGGFDAVQMRAVAEQADVALGTLYRYFHSKVHLLVATMQDQLEHLHGTLGKKPPTGDTAAERVAETLMRAFRALKREPHLADAMVRALTFADRSVSPEVDQVSRQTTAIILDAMGLENPTPEQLSAVRVIEHTWHSALITWLSGRASIAQVKIDIETVCRLIDLTAPA